MQPLLDGSKSFRYVCVRGGEGGVGGGWGVASIYSSVNGLFYFSLKGCGLAECESTDKERLDIQQNLYKTETSQSTLQVGIKKLVL